MIVLPINRRVPTTETPRCENLECEQRSGGYGSGSRGVIVESPIRQTILQWITPKGFQRKRVALLCCFCREEAQQGTTIGVVK